jgi:phosphate transport system substrate-binding protein
MTHIRGKHLRIFAAVAAIALIAAACGGDDDDSGSTGTGDAPQDLSGEIVISGSSTVEPISAANAQKFSAQYPDVGFRVDGPGTGDGFALFCEGQTDISDASRPIDPEEEAPLCEENGIEYVELKIGIDGITVLTAPENDQMECLNFQDLYALIGPESEGFDNWSDANAIGEELGSPHVPYPDAELFIVGPGEESGTYDSFAELTLEDIAYEERGIKEDDPVIRPDYQSSPNDNVIIEGIAGNPTSLGWVGYSFYQNNSDAVRAIPVAEEGDECVEPTDDTIKSAEYPISRFLYIYVNRAKLEENAALEPFVDFYLSEEGLNSVSEVGYVDLAEEDIATTMDAWETKETGSREG